MIIGITGSSGSGKTAVCKILKNKYSAKVIAADEISKSLSISNKNYLKEIVKHFGLDILLEDGNLNRKKLANIIYNDEAKRNLLNSCTFKYICEEIIKQIKTASEEIIVIDAPLLFEANLEEICDITIAVITNNKEEQIKRIITRDKIDRNEAIARINSQNSNEFYIKNCSYTIVNDNDIQNLETQINNILKKI